MAHLITTLKFHPLPLPLTYGAVFVWNGLDVQDVAGLNVGYVGPTDTMVTVVSRLGRL